MRKTLSIAVAVVAFSLLLLAEQNFGLNRTKSITFRENVTIASQVLPAGDYKVTHLMEGDNHIMLFKTARKQFRIGCSIVPLPSKSRDTQLLYEQQGEARVLTGMTFKGDSFQHRFEQ
jgi:hypothetical protein